MGETPFDPGLRCRARRWRCGDSSAADATDLGAARRIVRHPRESPVAPALWALLACIGFGSCAPKRVAAPVQAADTPVDVSNAARISRVRSAEPVVFALAGRSVVIPIVPEEGAAGAWIPATAPEVTFVTGERVPSETWWISGSPASAPATWEWLPPTAEWRAFTLAEVDTERQSGVDPLTTPGFWAVLARPPARASGRELRLDGRAMPVRWLADPPRATDVGRAPQPRASAEALRALGALLREEARDPLRRWRVGLMLDRWSAGRLWRDSTPPPVLEPEALEALAAQNEWRWRAALAALGRAGPDTAADVLARLTAVVLSPDGVLLPAWPLDDAGVARLRTTLLRADTEDDDRLNEAQAWLASLPPAVAWVVDDGPVVPSGVSEKDGASARRVRTAVSELTGKRARVSITPEGITPDDSRMVEEHESIVMMTEAAVGTRAIEPLRVQVGRWNGRVAFRATPVPVSPPGLTIGPLLPQWRMAGWAIGTPGAADPEWTTAGLLHKSADGNGWEVYVECRISPEAESLTGDVVRFYWGAEGSAERAVEVKAPTRAEAQRDRWTAVVPVPPRAVESDGTMRVSIERVDARGARSSWPRPMMPGEREPSRALVNLNAWGE
ncbi:MAG: hypothetical protein JNK58_02150 [Phycisphaerae bacterium]|nr:hypothetical protein [Phycisphaerae bacterium]